MQAQTIQMMQSDMEQLKTDNVKLYEKIKFLQRRISHLFENSLAIALAPPKERQWKHCQIVGRTGRNELSATSKQAQRL